MAKIDNTYLAIMQMDSNDLEARRHEQTPEGKLIPQRNYTQKQNQLLERRLPCSQRWQRWHNANTKQSWSERERLM